VDILKLTDGQEALVDDADLPGLLEHSWYPVKTKNTTSSQNRANRGKRAGASSQFLGVSRFRHKWQACIQVNGRGRALGKFESEREAAKAYNKAAFEAFGEFANLNEVP